MLPPQVRHQILSENEGQNQYVLWRGMASKGHLDLEPELPRKTNLIEVKYQGNKVRIPQLIFYSKTRKIDINDKKGKLKVIMREERRTVWKETKKEE